MSWSTTTTKKKETNNVSLLYHHNFFYLVFLFSFSLNYLPYVRINCDSQFTGEEILDFPFPVKLGED